MQNKNLTESCIWYISPNLRRANFQKDSQTYMYDTQTFDKLQVVTAVTHDTYKASHGGTHNFSDLFLSS